MDEMVLDNKIIWFVTVFKYGKQPKSNENLFSDITDSRCWGFYFNRDNAVNALHHNITDMHERLYNYAVIEGYREGIGHEVKEKRQFFKYDKERDGYFEIEEPEELKYLVSFSIG